MRYDVEAAKLKDIINVSIHRFENIFFEFHGLY